MNTIKSFNQLFEAKKDESNNEVEKFVTFSENRFSGASNISDMAHDKGGDALLTWHHFKVKLPYYKKAKAGKFDTEKAEAEYNELLDVLSKKTSGKMKIGQIEFQELVGKIEVLGELLIKHKDLK